jgi:putative flippase GtrA
VIERAPARTIVIIPAYQPTETLVALVEELTRVSDRPIVIVDDGSSLSCRPVFDRLARHPQVVLLAHAVNLGKGQALKTAFNHVLLNASGTLAGVVTADADGQHLAADIERVAARLEQLPDTLILGSRSFDASAVHVPLPNRIGNILTRRVFRLVVGRRLADTQTGLRGIPRAFLPVLLTIEAARYEFELEMLVRAMDRGVPIEELPIATVYGPQLRSHFSPLRDSLRIYFVFLRFVGLSMVTAAIDYSIFAAVYAAGHNILLATSVARAVAGVFNFSANRLVVFRSRSAVVREAIRYAALVIALMWVSYGLVTTLVLELGVNVYVSKLLAEGTLFAASFALQNLFVFGRTRGEAQSPRATDWDAYYRRPAAFAPITRRFTERVILREAGRVFRATAPSHIVELGGGNSPFLAALRARYPAARLTAIDTNALGLGLLQARLPADPGLTLVERDVLTPVPEIGDADLVFSVGLIEHFDAAETARAIGAHFDLVRDGGTVLITYPTPTWLYRTIRSAAELLGVWEFPDERPLERGEVNAVVAQHGEIVDGFINWPVVLTQAVVVSRKHACADKSMNVD